MWIHYHPDIKQYIQNVKESEASVKASVKYDIVLDRDYKQAEKVGIKQMLGFTLK
jgi:hypothetical protein